MTKKKETIYKILDAAIEHLNCHEDIVVINRTELGILNLKDKKDNILNAFDNKNISREDLLEAVDEVKGIEEDKTHVCGENALIGIVLSK